MCYAHLTVKQRYQIEGWKQRGCPVARMARKLGVHRSTIYRELARGGHARQGYLAWRAEAKAARRRRRSAANHRSKPHALWRLIRRLIARDWSPEQVRGYLKRFHGPAASVPAIYAHLRRVRELAQAHLRYGRRRHRWGKHSTGSLPPDRSRIEARPAAVARRRQPGHWEGDTLMGSSRSPHRLLALVERTSRYLRLRRPAGKGSLAGQVAKTTARALRRLPIRSLTLDNGTEFARFRQISQALACRVYFTHPHSPWERGTCENTIGLLRQYIPKGTSGVHLTTAQIHAIEHKLNQRPRKCLGFKTPAEVLLHAHPPVALRT